MNKALNITNAKTDLFRSSTKSLAIRVCKKLQKTKYNNY